MRVVYHPAVQKDVNGILRYYDDASPKLADEFWDELRRVIDLIAENPDRAHPAERGLWRVNLRRFPYHILFRGLPLTIRVIVVRHDKRHPHFGTSRR
jgi:plasmid stabilization system protein ParE